MTHLRSIISSKIGKAVILFALCIFLLAIFNIRIGTVIGISMEPTLSAGDVIIYSSGHYGIGDIIIFEHPKGYKILHRVVATNGEDCRTKGDNNESLDKYIIFEEMILGKIRVIIPGIAKRFIREGKR